jgi:hypothetical protein
MNNLSSFPAGSNLPNGVAASSSLIWSGHFTTQEIIAYNYAGVEQYRFSTPGYSNLQGLELVGSDLVIANGNQLVFFDAYSGAYVRSIPSGGSTVEGLAYDGQYIWQLGDQLLATDPANGNIVYTIPNAGINAPYGGTGLTMTLAGTLMIAGADGSWYEVSKTDGSVISSGNNGLDMYGLGTLIPEPASLVLLTLGALLLRRR